MKLLSRLITVFSVVILLVSGCRKETVNADRQKEMVKCIVNSIEGKVFVKADDQSGYLPAAPGDLLNQESSIRTDAGSTAELLINQASLIRVKENSILSVRNLSADSSSQNVLLHLKKGKLLAYPEKQSVESSFEIETASITAGVRGTQFTVVADDTMTQVAVNEGQVFVKNRIAITGMETIQTKHPELLNQINRVVDTGVMVDPNEMVEIKTAKTDELQNKINQLIETTMNRMDQKVQKDQVMEEMETVLNGKIVQDIQETIVKKTVSEKEMVDEYDKMEFGEMLQIKKEMGVIGDSTSDTGSLNSTETTSTTIEKKEVIRFEKISAISDTFPEKSTFITAGNDKNIYITNGFSKTVYCYSTESLKLLWKFTDPSIKSLTSAAVPYKGTAVLAASNQIFVIRNGRSILTTAIANGPSFWAGPVAVGGVLYIPTSQELYQYDGTSMTPVPAAAKARYYLSAIGKQLFLLDSLYQKIYAYDPASGEIKWTSDKLLNNSFTLPVMSGNYLVTADNENTLYRFDIASGQTGYEKVSMTTGVTGNLALYQSGVYFVGNDGNLYQINIKDFKSPVMILKADRSPDMNKYLVKRLVLSGNELLYGTDTGKLLVYHLSSGKSEMVVPDDNHALPFVGSPVVLNGVIYLMDTAGQIYQRYTALESVLSN